MLVVCRAGYGDVYPLHLAARLAVCMQLIISMCYTILILGQALASTVRYLNQIRLERAAEGAGGGGAGAGAAGSSSAGRGKRRAAVPAPIPEEDEEIEISAVSLSGFEGRAPYGEEGSD